MAVIGSIRKRTGLLIGFIAVALLLFLLMDALSSNSLMGGAGNQKVGTIDGKKVDYLSYQRNLSNYEERVTTLFPNAAIDPANRAQFRDEVWNNFAMDALLGKDLWKMGLSVSADELGNAMWGDDVHFFAQNVLVNPQTGQYDRAFARQYVIAADENEDVRKRVRFLEELIEDDRLKTKYTTLFTKGMYVPDFMAKDEKANSQTTADITYIYYPYSDVADTDITITDKDLVAYINAHKEKFKQEETREIKFYSIDIVPSAQDTADTYAAVTKLLEEFKAAENDSLFVKRNSDIPWSTKYFTQSEIATDPNAEALFTDPVGTYYDPYQYNGAINSAKLVDRKLIPDSVKARHILLVPTSFDQVDSLRALADSLVNLLKDRKASFEELAAIHSQDQSNAANGGDLDFFKPGDMVAPFNDAAFYKHKQGDIYTVDSRFGIHIVRIDEAKPVTPAVRTAVVAQRLEYSKDTERDLFRDANKFRQEHDTPEKFEAAAEAKPITEIRVTKNQVAVAGIADARDIIRWAFTEKVGAINYFDIDDKYIIAYLSGKIEEGPADLEDVRVQVQEEVKKEKKAAVIAEKIKAANANNIQALASATGTEVSTAQALGYKAVNIQGSGSEPKAVAAVFGLNEGDLSGPLKGSTGVYVVQLNKLNKPQSVDNFFAEKTRLKSRATFTTILSDLKENADIDDKRYEFY